LADSGAARAEGRDATEPQNQRETAQAAREMLGHCLRGVAAATRYLDLVQKTGSAAEFLEALELWEQSVKQAQVLARACWTMGSRRGCRAEKR